MDRKLRIFTILLIVTLVLFLSGCIKKRSSDTNSNDDETQILETIEDNENEDDPIETEEKKDPKEETTQIEFDIIFSPSRTNYQNYAVVQELIDFTITDKSLDSKEIRWTFGDGDSDTGIQVSHIYSQSSTFKVTVNYRDSYSKEYEVYIVNHNDEHNFGSEEPGVAIRNESKSVIGFGYELQSGLTIPSISLSLNIPNVYGNLNYRAYTEDSYGNIVEIDQNNITLSNEPYDLDEMYIESNLVASLPSMFRFEVIVTNGFRSSYSGSILINYLTEEFYNE